ncbi:MAG: DUF1574 family protein [Nitrospirae bacterium]|nr:DUF1574 family protein [Nitrospirota bacterium]
MRIDRDFYRYDNKILMLGDSHSMTGLNSEIIGDAFNFSSGGANYMKTYYKLKYILNDKPRRFKVLIIPFDLHSFASNRSDVLMDSYYWKKYVNYWELGLRKKNLPAYLTEYLRGNYFPYAGEFGNVYLYFKDGQQNVGKEKYRKVIKGYMIDDENYSKKDKMKLARTRTEEHFKGTKSVDEDLVFYFNKIVSLASGHGIKIILIKFPITDEYYSIASEMMQVDKYNAQINSLVEGKPDMFLWDYQNFFFDKDYLFSDSDHLNTAGATEFSNIIKDRLKSEGILDF